MLITWKKREKKSADIKHHATEITKRKKEILPLTDEDGEPYNSQKFYQICKQKFDDVDNSNDINDIKDSSDSDNNSNDKELISKSLTKMMIKFVIQIIDSNAKEFDLKKSHGDGDEIKDASNNRNGEEFHSMMSRRWWGIWCCL